jgi:hypothetical protein
VIEAMRKECPMVDDRQQPEHAVQEFTISDTEFQALRATARTYTGLILRHGPNRRNDGADAIIYQHGMRNAALYQSGRLPIVCPVMNGTDVCGLGIFDVDLAEAASIMDADPAVQAGVLVYELVQVRSFPGSTLPA